jgi:predicted site-specific integrase-resolvase
MSKNDLMTVPEFAKALGVRRETVTRWVQAGKVKGFKKDPFQARTAPVFIPRSELVRVKKQMDQQEKEFAS